MKSGIYCIENLINGKKYIGQSININNRFKNHERNFRNNSSNLPKLKNAVNKYGKENFIFYEIEFCPKEQLDERERYWISILKTYKKGYNSTKGGKDGEFCKETRKRMSKKNARIYKNKFNGEHNCAKKIYQYDLDGNFIKEWCAIVECARYYNVDECIIGRVVNGKRLRWKEFRFFFNYYGNKIEKYNNKVMIYNLPIYQYSLEGNFIRKWDNTSQACKELGINIITLRAALNKENCNCNGFLWKKEYRNDTIDSYKPIYSMTGRKGKDNCVSVKVYQYSLSGEFLKEWDSITDACCFYKTGVGNIGACLSLKSRQAVGFYWTKIFKGTKIDPIKVRKKNTSKYDMETNNIT